MANSFLKPPIGIWGTGKVGRSAAHWLNKHNLVPIFFDEKKVGNWDLPYKILEDKEQFFSQIKTLIPSPGVPSFKYSSRDIEVVSELNLFGSYYLGYSIAVTGTLGKTTTVLLLSHCLKQSGVNSCAIGNIGEPILSWEPELNSIPVIELSSFQLELPHCYKPTISIITNLYANHLDHHLSFDAYRQAKLNLIRNQSSGLVIVNRSLACDIRKENKDNLTIFYIGLVEDLKPNESCIILEDNKIFLCGYSSKKFIGDFLEFSSKINVAEETISIVLAVFEYLNINFNCKYLDGFIAPEHRGEIVAIKDGVKYLDDSKSTVPQATLYALKKQSLPTILLLGGISKGVDRSFIFAELSSCKQLKSLILFGAEAVELSLKATNYLDNIFVCKTVEEAVSLAKKIAEPDNVVLFSPAGASFDLFNNYHERGQRFKELVAL